MARASGWNKGWLLNKGWSWEQEAAGLTFPIRGKDFCVSREEETSAKVKTGLVASVRVRERCLAGSF